MREETYPSPIRNTPIRIPPPYPFYDPGCTPARSRTRQNILNLISNEDEYAKNVEINDGLVTEPELFCSSTASTLGRSVSVETTRHTESVNHSLASFGQSLSDDNYVTSTVARSWEYVNVSLTRVPGYGFGIAVSGGCDNPHFANGDPAIAISDVLKGGPAQGKLQINDRIISANGISLDNVDYSTAVQILRDSGPSVNLRVKRRVNPQSCRVSIPINSKRLKKLTYENLGFTVSVTLQIKTVENSALGLREGDIIDKIDNYRVNDLFNEKLVCKELRRTIEDQVQNTVLNLTVKRNASNRITNLPPQTNGHIQPALIPVSQSIGNLYVQPPTRANNKSFDSTNTPLPPPPIQVSSPPPPPPRPPLPNEYEEQSRQSRTINFIKQNQLGIRLSGGNSVGIIVSAVQKNSQADLQGLQVNDKIIKVNEHDFTVNPPTREQAIEVLSSIPNDTLVNLTVEKLPGPVNFDHQDEFYIRTNVSTEDFKLHEVLLVTDTLVNGLVGSWEAHKLDPQGNKTQRFIIPNIKNARELLKKSWKRTTSFRNREFEELLNSVPASDPYTNVFRRVAEIHTRPVIILSPINSNILECMGMLKHSSRLLKVVKTTSDLDFNDMRVRVLTEIPSVRGIQELYESGVYPYVVHAHFPSKDPIKEALKDNNKYSRAKKLYSVLTKLSEKLGSFVNLTIEVHSAEHAAQRIYDLITHGNISNSVFYAPQKCDQQSQTPQHHSNITTTTPPKRSQSTPRSFSSKDNYRSTPPTHQHVRVHSTDSLRYDTSSAAAATNSPLKFPNFNALPPQAIIDAPTSDLPTPRRNTTTLENKNRPSNNFAHSPVTDKRDFARSQSNPPPTQSYGSPPPMIDRTKKPVGGTPSVFYPVSNVNSPAKLQNTPKPLPPPKPRLTSTLSRRSPNRALFTPSSATSDIDDTGQTYLNIPMGSKVAQQQVQQQQQQNNLSNVTSGVFDWRGGKLIQTNVPKQLIPIEVFIPEGAIPRGETITVWFQVVDYNIRDDNQNPLAQKKMLSPLVKFGPENYRFLTPVNISIPQYVSSNTPAKVLMNNQSDYWTKIDIQNGNFDANESEVKLVSLTVQQF